jgi:hypothetical protein
MAFQQIALPTTTQPHAQAAVLQPPALPFENGGGYDVDLVCGGCGAVLAEGFVDLSHYHVDYQLIIVCPKCGAKNVGSATVTR